MKDRLKQVIEYYGITPHAFSQKIGVTEGTIRKILNENTTIRSDNLEKISQTFTDINLDWLLTGRGHMLRKSLDHVDKKTDIVLIPVLNLDARGGFEPNNFTDTSQTVVRFIPFERSIARDSDVVIPIFGDSMSPIFPGGSLVLIRQYEHWRDYIDFGNTFVVELNDDSRFIKVVNKGSSPDTITLHSVNSTYTDNEVPVKIIRRMYRVIMTVRQEVL